MHIVIVSVYNIVYVSVWKVEQVNEIIWKSTGTTSVILKYLINTNIRKRYRFHPSIPRWGPGSISTPIINLPHYNVGVGVLNKV